MEAIFALFAAIGALAGLGIAALGGGSTALGIADDHAR